MSNVNGVTAQTMNNIEFEQGVVLKQKYTSGTLDKSNVLCATTGGIRVNISPILQNIAFDGMLENTAGLERVIGYTASIQFSTKEVDAEKVKKALGYASVTTSSGTTTVTPLHGVVTAETYEPLYILGKLGDNTWRQICINKAMNVNGLQETRNNKNEVEIAFDLQARYTIDDQDTAPVNIEYISAT